MSTWQHSTATDGVTTTTDERHAPFQFSLNLHENTSADVQSAYQIQNLPGEQQRRAVIDRSGKGELSVLAELQHVIHGSLTPTGPKASLIVIDFRFTGSNLQKRRFRSVTIEINFAHGTTTPLGTSPDPEIIAISPDGEFYWNHTTAVGTVHIGVSLAAGVAGPNADGDSQRPEQTSGYKALWAKTRPSTVEGQATLFGAKRIVNRKSGPWNAGKWVLRENRQRKCGIPSRMSTAIIVKPPSQDGKGEFSAMVKVFAEVDVYYSVESAIKRMTGSCIVDPIHFHQDLEQVGPNVDGLQADNLSKAIEDGILQSLGRVPSMTE